MPEIYKPPPLRLRRRAWLLYLLALPLLPVALIALLRGDVEQLLASIGGFGLLTLGGRLTGQGLAAEADKTRRAQRSRVPRKLLGAICAAAGTFTASFFLVGHGGLFAGLLAGFAWLGCGLYYGLDRGRPLSVRGASEDVIALLEEAETRIGGIEEAARSIRNSELSTRLRRIAEKARAVLGVIEDDPRDARRARKFLKVYLEGARKVASGYAKLHPQSDSAELEENFRSVLVTIEDVFVEQHQKLLENDVLDLDVQIEVLAARLEREGVI